MARLFIVGSTSDRLWEIDPAGAATQGTSRTLPSGLTFAQGMTVLNGQLMVIDNSGDELWRLNPDGADGEGTRLREFPSGLRTPDAMTVYNGRLLIIDSRSSDELWEVDPTGGDDQGTLLRGFPSTLNGIRGMTVYNNRLFIVDSLVDELWEIDPDAAGSQGTKLRDLPTGFTFTPTGMTVHEGRLFITEQGSSSFPAGLWELDPAGAGSEGTELRNLPTNLNAPRGLASLPEATTPVGDGFTSGEDTLEGVAGPAGDGFSSGGNDRFGTVGPPIAGFRSGSDSFKAIPPSRLLMVVEGADIADSLWELDPNGANGEGVKLRDLPTLTSQLGAMTIYQSRVIVADFGSDQLWEVDPDGTTSQGSVLRDLPSGLDSPQAMTVYNGRLLIADAAGPQPELWELDPDGGNDQGTKIRNLPTTLFPDGMTVHNGRLLIAGSALWEIDPDGAATQGTRLRDFPPNQPGTQSGLSNPSSMTSHEGRLFIVGNRANEPDRLWEIDPDGDLHQGTYRTLPSGTRNPAGLASLIQVVGQLSGGFTSGADILGAGIEEAAGFKSAADSFGAGVKELTGFRSGSDSFGFSSFTRLLAFEKHVEYDGPLAGGQRTIGTRIDRLWEINPDGAGSEGTVIRNLTTPNVRFLNMVILNGRVLMLMLIPATLHDGRLSYGVLATHELWELNADGDAMQATKLRGLTFDIADPEVIVAFKGRLIVTVDSNTLWEIDPDGADNEGTLLRYTPPDAQRDGMTVRVDGMADYNGRLLITTAPRESEIWEIDPDGEDSQGTRLRYFPAELQFHGNQTWDVTSVTVQNGRLLAQGNLHTERTMSTERSLWDIDPDGADFQGIKLRDLPSDLTDLTNMAVLEYAEVRSGFDGSPLDRFEGTGQQGGGFDSAADSFAYEGVLSAGLLSSADTMGSAAVDAFVRLEQGLASGTDEFGATAESAFVALSSDFTSEGDTFGSQVTGLITAGFGGNPDELGLGSLLQSLIEADFTSGADSFGGAAVDGFNDADGGFTSARDTLHSVADAYISNALSGGFTDLSASLGATATDAAGNITAGLASGADTFGSMAEAYARLPSAPRNLTATEEGKNTIVLAWDAPEDDGGGAVTGYHIECQEITATEYEVAAGLDGDFVQQVFHRSTTSTPRLRQIVTPADRRNDRQDVEYVPFATTDDPAGVDSANPYEWFAVRHYSPLRTPKWTEFSSWRLFARYGADGTRYKELTIYRRASLAFTPPRPGATGSYWFHTNILSPPTNWSVRPPSHTKDQVVWASVATADDIAGSPWRAGANDWSFPFQYLRDADINIIYRKSGTQPATPAKSSGVPTGWYDSFSDIPSTHLGVVYACIGQRPAGERLFTWQPPYRLEGLPGRDGTVLDDGDITCLLYTSPSPRD